MPRLERTQECCCPASTPGLAPLHQPGLLTVSPQHTVLIAVTHQAWQALPHTAHCTLHPAAVPAAGWPLPSHSTVERAGQHCSHAQFALPHHRCAILRITGLTRQNKDCSPRNPTLTACCAPAHQQQHFIINRIQTTLCHPILCCTAKASNISFVKPGSQITKASGNSNSKSDSIG